MRGRMYQITAGIGKSAGGPQVNLRFSGWRPNVPESKKSARQR